MAIQTKENFKGFDLPEAYMKIDSVLLRLSVYKDIEGRVKSEALETRNLHLKITPEIYAELKKQFPDAIDHLEEL